MLGCLGTANYWLTLPLLAIVASAAVLALAMPDRMPFPRPGPRWIGQVIAVLVLVVVAVFAVNAIDEARTDPD